MREPGFFHLLSLKLSVRPDRNFDQRFWSNFESEFGEKAAPGFWQRIGVPARLSLVGAGAASFLVATAIFLSSPLRDSFGPGAPFASSDFRSNAAMLVSMQQYPDLWENYDMLEALDDVSFTDQEWDVLLNGAPPAAGESS